MGLQASPRVVVVGAGISGLICARSLADQGVSVTVFEKSRGVGGRMTNRRATAGLRFDHGAQYFTIRNKEFDRHVRSWLDEGIVASWKGHIVAIEHGKITNKKQTADFYVATPGMNAICKRLAADLDLSCETCVTSIERSQNQWRLISDDGAPLGDYDVALVTAPAEQAAVLLSAAPSLADQARAAHMRPCWAIMLALSESLDLSFDGAFVHQSPLSWIARNNSLPSRPLQPETWILHASPEWSEANLDKPSEAVEKQLVAAFWCAVGLPPQDVVYRQSHRWLFALPSAPLQKECLFDRQMQIGACGDWCGGPNVEGAFLSGLAAAACIKSIC